MQPSHKQSCESSIQDGMNRVMIILQVRLLIVVYAVGYIARECCMRVLETKLCVSALCEAKIAAVICAEGFGVYFQSIRG